MKVMTIPTLLLNCRHFTQAVPGWMAHLNPLPFPPTRHPRSPPRWDRAAWAVQPQPNKSSAVLRARCAVRLFVLSVGAVSPRLTSDYLLIGASGGACLPRCQVWQLVSGGANFSWTGPGLWAACLSLLTLQLCLDTQLLELPFSHLLHK